MIVQIYCSIEKVFSGIHVYFGAVWEYGREE